jgi:hypothetical protein
MSKNGSPLIDDFAISAFPDDVHQSNLTGGQPRGSMTALMQTFFQKELHKRISACRRAAKAAYSDELKRMFREREDELRELLRPGTTEACSRKPAVPKPIKAGAVL